MPEKKRSALMNFLFPKITWGFCVRLISIAALAYGFFGFICRPAVIHGVSMEPTYRNGAFVFCWTPAYWKHEPQRGDVVMIRYGGDRVMLFKRILALEGDVIEFREGVLHLNNEPVREPWASLTPCDWNLEPRTVAPGCVYVVGDNRSMPMDEHVFGETEKTLIVGKASLTINN